MTNVGFGGLTITAVPVVNNTGSDIAPVWTLNTTSLPAATVIAGILDPAGGINRLYNPFTVGLTAASGDAVAKWLPQINSNGLVATQVYDNYWAAIPGQVAATSYKFGQIAVTLTPGTSDTVRASSVMSFRVSPNAFFLVATGTFA